MVQQPTADRFRDARLDELLGTRGPGARRAVRLDELDQLVAERIYAVLEQAQQTAVAITLGPFYVNDAPGTATTDATLAYFDSATTLTRAGNEIRMDRPGRVVGVIITSDDARTAGTATVAVEVNNASQAFNGGAVALDATNTTSDSSFVAFANGVPFAAGDTLGAEVTTSGWTPTTANLAIWLVVMLTPF